jgi:hypothetical protein
MAFQVSPALAVWADHSGPERHVFDADERGQAQISRPVWADHSMARLQAVKTGQPAHRDPANLPIL